ncbi:hypothetical protein Tco_0531362 [Tanacetum coccineum]
MEAVQLIASGERASLSDMTRSLEWENLKVRALLSIERDRVDSLRHHMALSQEEFCQIRRDRDDARRRLRRMESFVDRTFTHSGMILDNRRTRNDPIENGRSAKPVACVCTYQDFMKCQPLNFKGTEGVVGLTRCFEKMEIVLHISNCPEVFKLSYDAVCYDMERSYEVDDGSELSKERHTEDKN